MKKSDPIKYLIEADPILANVIKRSPRPEWRQTKDFFRALVEDIIGQQLSGKAADTITGRFNLLFTKHPYTPQQVLGISDESIRKAGISYGKISYIKDLAQKTLDGILEFEKIHLLSDDDVVDHLIQVKGIGQWTAEMFLMFSLGREDVFSYGDQGLKNAIQRLYKLRRHPSPKQAELISNKWRPYRTWACRYLWTSLVLKI